MDFRWSAEEDAFRQEIQEFLRAELPEGWGVTQFWDPDDDEQFFIAHEFTKKLGAKNWLAVSWPKEYGGLEWPFWQQFIFNEELANFDAPVVGRTNLYSQALCSKSDCTIRCAGGRSQCYPFSRPNGFPLWHGRAKTAAHPGYPQW